MACTSPAPSTGFEQQARVFPTVGPESPPAPWWASGGHSGWVCGTGAGGGPNTPRGYHLRRLCHKRPNRRPNPSALV